MGTRLTVAVVSILVSLTFINLGAVYVNGGGLPAFNAFAAVLTAAAVGAWIMTRSGS